MRGIVHPLPPPSQALNGIPTNTQAGKAPTQPTRVSICPCLCGSQRALRIARGSHQVCQRNAVQRAGIAAGLCRVGQCCVCPRSGGHCFGWQAVAPHAQRGGAHEGAIGFAPLWVLAQVGVSPGLQAIE